MVRLIDPYRKFFFFLDACSGRRQCRASSAIDRQRASSGGGWHGKCGRHVQAMSTLKSSHRSKAALSSLNIFVKHFSCSIWRAAGGSLEMLTSIVAMIAHFSEAAFRLSDGTGLDLRFSWLACLPVAE